MDPEKYYSVDELLRVADRSAGIDPATIQELYKDFMKWNPFDREGS